MQLLDEYGFPNEGDDKGKMEDFMSAVEILQQAARAFRAPTLSRPDAEILVDALLQAEKSARRYPQEFSFDQLIGQWRLCFATGTRKLRQGGIKLKKGYYLPRLGKAQIAFARDEAGAEKISNLAKLGPFQLQFSGPARFQTKKNLLAFEFTQIQMSWGQTILRSSPIRGGVEKEKAFAETSVAKLPFFAFFFISEDVIAARGRGGGLAIWIKE